MKKRTPPKNAKNEGPVRNLLPEAQSAATPPDRWTVVSWPRKRRGPAPGAVDRYSKSDRACYPELKWLIREHKMSVEGAARKLLETRVIAGAGTPESRARRLAKRYRADSH